VNLIAGNLKIEPFWRTLISSIGVFSAKTQKCFHPYSYTPKAPVVLFSNLFYLCETLIPFAVKKTSVFAAEVYVIL
jgi:hypothetical protein